ncbi:hypothetical protein BOTBODRAFT_125948 [Botryobasidium botryosum FD-172 SS1]|uniref:ABC1 atypical kinase-like domain-containing protein n=1 Tax=Botryobasidium botryosum (strain FD-172 SS1) TaxID=930990 RepID=A0A067MX96_BOTB1|nr:hypothetical protein BOTBODRAFT_125948 [Botryobasidium botryosum FD-172 SS1]
MSLPRLSLRLRALPSPLHLSVSHSLAPTRITLGPARQVTRGPSTANFSSARPANPSFFFHPPRPRPTHRQYLLLVPIAGSLALYFYPRQHAIVPTLLASPVIIPCKPSASHSFPISSPAEQELSYSIPKRIILFLNDRIWQPILTARRFIYLCAIFSPVLFTLPMLLVGEIRDRKHSERWGAIWWYDLLVRQMQLAGPTFIKLAQWAASRADLFPDALCDRLGTLQSAGTPHSFAHTVRVIERAFELPFAEVFEEFDQVPIGTGAIAQVYRAKLRPELISQYVHIDDVAGVDGAPSPFATEVAIKILHPHVEKMISRDLAIMSCFARILTLLPGMEWLSLPEEVEVFGTIMREQLDLRNEVCHLNQFEKNFRGRRAAVTFPRPLEMASHKDVLVEEYVDALPLKAFMKNGGGPFDQTIANLGLDAFLNMLLIDNFVHSDLHAGNIMVKFYKPSTRFVLRNIYASIFNVSQPPDPIHMHDFTAPSQDPSAPAISLSSDPIVARLRPFVNDPEAWATELEKLAEEGYQPALVFIDTGLVTTLNMKNRANFLELFRAIAEFDGYRAGTLMVQRCRTPELAIDPETFALRMQHIVLSVKSKTFSLRKIKISDILTDVLTAVRTHHVKMEPDFFNTVISVLLLEGIGRRLDPDMDLFRSALPILRQLGRQISAKDAMSEISSGNFGAMFKIWVWIEARELASAAFASVDEMVRYDWLTPSI